MYIKRLEIKNFRSYKHLQLNPDKDLNFFLGANATGKTNILESIYYAALLRSPKTNLEKEIIRFGEEFSVIKMEIVKKHVTNEIKIYLNRQGEKKILIDDNPIRKISDIIDKLGVVFFCPEDMTVVQGSAVARRTFLNIGMSVISSRFYEEYNNYKKLLQQKVCLLKKPVITQETIKELDAWDDLLSKSIHWIIQQREIYISKLNAIAKEKYKKISNNKEELNLSYESTIQRHETSQEIFEEIKRERDRDIEYRCARKGPHRDDIILSLDGIDARKFASQGQQRTVALALKLSELELYRQYKGEPAILLLDDVLGELDRYRQEELIKAIYGQQTFVTSTEYDKQFKGTIFEVFKENGSSFIKRIK